MQLSVAVKTYFIPRYGAQEILGKKEFACILLRERTDRSSPTNKGEDWRVVNVKCA